MFNEPPAALSVETVIANLVKRDISRDFYDEGKSAMEMKKERESIRDEEILFSSDCRYSSALT